MRKLIILALFSVVVLAMTNSTIYCGQKVPAASPTMAQPQPKDIPVWFRITVPDTQQPYGRPAFYRFTPGEYPGPPQLKRILFRPPLDRSPHAEDAKRAITETGKPEPPVSSQYKEVQTRAEL